MKPLDPAPATAPSTPAPAGRAARARTVDVTITVNGVERSATVPAATTLLAFIRETAHLTGTKEGCGTGECGACTVVLDGKPIRTCLTLAAECDGASVTTIEALAPEGVLHPIQEAFIETGAIQCGFCSPGFILAAFCLLQERDDPTREDIDRAMSGHLCRCTGYEAIFEAVRLAGRWKREGRWR